jgi:deazaflavin-dependent oxidoreductase (nitroreductase family)
MARVFHGGLSARLSGWPTRHIGRRIGHAGGDPGGAVVRRSSVITIAATVAVALAGPGLVIGLGLRRRWPVVLDGLRRFSRSTINPGQLATAGQPGAYASVIEHRGRVSGSTYRTPVVVRAVEDGWVVSLTYGTRADWVRNVVAAGHTTLVTEGRTIEQVTSRVVPLASPEAARWLSAGERRLLGWFGIDTCLRLTPPRGPTPDAES